MDHKKQKALSEDFINSINTNLFQIFQMGNYPQNKKHWYVKFKHSIPYMIHRNEDGVGNINQWCIWKVGEHFRERVLQVTDERLENAVRYCYEKYLSEMKSEIEIIEKLISEEVEYEFHKKQAT